MVILTTVGTGAAYGQDSSPQPVASASSDVETAVVTGSRISNSGLTSDHPISTLSAQDIEATGVSNVGDLIIQQTQFVPGSDSSNGTFGAHPGLQTVNLNGLGANRTLVLIDGVRQVSGVVPGVDINTISPTLLERVDIVTGGTSAVYGADAIAGVVNFITRKNLDGIIAHVQGGTSDKGDALSAAMAMSAGMNFDNGRGNFTLSASYNSDGGLMRSQRGYAESGLAYVANPAATGTNGLPLQIASVNINQNTTANNGAPVIITPIGNNAAYSQTFTTAGALTPFNRGQIIFNNSGAATTSSVGGAGYRQTIDTIKSPEVRDGLEAQFRYTLLEHTGVFESVDFYASGKYYSSGGNTIFPSNGFAGTTPGTTNGSAYTIQKDNAYLPTALVSELTAANLTSFTVTRRNVDFSPEASYFKSTLRRGVAGFEGKFSNDWHFQIYNEYSETRDNTIIQNDIVVPRLQSALDAVVNASGNIVCRSTLTTPNNGCVPLDIFGIGQASQAAINSISYTGNIATLTSQEDALASIDGTLFEMPSLISGSSLPISFAAGLEYRREYFNQLPDAVLQAGNDSLFGLQAPTKGAFDTKEAFFELAAPLLRDVPFIKELSFNGSYRYANFSTSGGNDSYSAGLIWAINDTLRFRANYAKAVRAPSVTELDAGSTTGFSLITDPCDSSQLNAGVAPANRRANCAALGIPTNFVQSTTTKASTTTGNPKLSPEIGTTITLGAVITPDFVPGLSLSADYYHIGLSAAIVSPTAQSIVSNCVDLSSIKNAFCPQVTRDSSYNVSLVGAAYLNAASYSTEGWDFSAAYEFGLADAGLPDYGSISLMGDATYVMSLSSNSIAGNPATYVQQAGAGSDPKIRTNLYVRWDYENISFGTTLHYTSSVNRLNADAANNYAPEASGDWTTVDMRGEYRIDDRYTLFLGMNNVMDRDPPFKPFTYVGNGDRVSGDDGSLYSNVGRYLYAGIDIKLGLPSR